VKKWSWGLLSCPQQLLHFASPIEFLARRTTGKNADDHGDLMPRRWHRADGRGRQVDTQQRGTGARIERRYRVFVRTKIQ
jgi:hypothetical protein